MGPSGGNREARHCWDTALNYALRGRAAELAEALPIDAVETVLGDALRAATAQGRWADVAQLAHELEDRRRARSATIDLVAERAKRETP